MKQASLEEWQEIGKRSKAARDNLRELLLYQSSHLPRSIDKHLLKAMRELDNYRSKAEEEMLRSGKSDDLTVFFGMLSQSS